MQYDRGGTENIKARSKNHLKGENASLKMLRHSGEYAPPSETKRSEQRK